MPRGGARPGGGRPKGSANKRTQELVAKLSADGVSPLEVMLQTMRTHHANGDLDKASAIAKDAAPYLHPRLQAIEHKGDLARPLQVVVVRFADLPGDDAEDPKLIEHDAV